MASVDCKAHVIRARAAFLARAHNTSLSSILDAAFWRNPGTFIEFYRGTSLVLMRMSRGRASAGVANKLFLRLPRSESLDPEW